MATLEGGSVDVAMEADMKNEVEPQVIHAAADNEAGDNIDASANVEDGAGEPTAETNGAGQQEEQEKQGKTYRAGEMVSETKEELYDNMKYTQAVRDKLTELIDSGWSLPSGPKRPQATTLGIFWPKKGEFLGAKV